jgi:4-nitrophenyl phosphatase/NagD protein
MSSIKRVNKEKLSKVKLFLLDLDGTFYLGSKILGGSMKFINKVKETGRDFMFLTNNSSKNSTFYAEKITKMGCPITPEKAFTSSLATISHLKSIKENASVYIVGTEYLIEDFRNAGFNMTDENPDFVILGFDTTLTYEKLCKICSFIDKGVRYIATHPDFVCPVEGGFIPDVGSFMELIKAATGKVPEAVIGKPNPFIIEAVMKLTGYGKDEIAMVGDRMYTDIAVGINAGITSVLVLSGETSAEDAERSTINPDIILDDLGELADYL